MAELPSPQSLELAMCPPQAKTTVEAVALKVIRIRLDEDEEFRFPRLPSSLLMYSSFVIVPL